MLKKLFQSVKKWHNPTKKLYHLGIKEIEKIQLDSELNCTITKKHKSELPNSELIKEFVGTEKEFTDENGYSHEIIALVKKNENLCIIESKAKHIGEMLDISIKCKINSNGELVKEQEIESYNPYFGCDVHYLDWIKDIAIFVYTEKHNTYIGKYKIGGEIVFQNIGKSWKNSGSIFAFRKWNDKNIYVLKIPELEIVGRIDKESANKLGINPD